MIKKVLIGVIGSAFLVLAGIFGLMLYVMSDMEIEHLISCSSNEGGTRIPSGLCEYYMLNHRITESDIEQLGDGAGLEYILNSENPKKYKIAEIFISKGLDVNGINHYIDKDVTPLHAAVMYNDVERVKFLIKQGANVHIVSNGYGMTALELAKRFHEETGKENRSEIIQLLSDAESE